MPREPGLELPPRRVLAVFRNDKAASDVVGELVAAGIQREHIRIGDPSDRRTELLTEMRAEANPSRLRPSNHSPEVETRGATAILLLATAIGVIIGVLVSLIPFGWEWWVRLVVLAAVGGAAGASVGFIAGPGLMARGPVEPSVAAEGTVVSVNPASTRAVEVLRDATPVRLDVLAIGDESVASAEPAAEEDSTTERVAERFRSDPTAQEDWSTENQ